MTTQELLQRRKKVMIKYPNSPFEVGEILMQRTSNSKVFRKLNDHSIGVIADDFPDIFKEMNWWEERDEKDMPEYVKDIYEGEVHFVESWEHLIFWTGKTEKGIEFMQDDIIPASKEEYEQYLSLQKQQS